MFFEYIFYNTLYNKKKFWYFNVANIKFRLINATNSKEFYLTRIKNTIYIVKYIYQWPNFDNNP